jgi:flavodoxin
MILVTFLSETGNTRRIASAIHSEIDGPVRFIGMESADPAVPYDLIFAGFPVWQFGPAGPARQYLAKLPGGQKVALFVTHAMDPDPVDPGQRKMLDAILARCRNAAAHLSLAGFFHCRGELSEAATSMLLESGMPLLASFAAMHDETIGHPDEAEIQQAATFAREILHETLHQ